MNRIQIHLNRFVYNSKLNKEIFIINKNKINWLSNKKNYPKCKATQVRKYHTTRQKTNNKDPNGPKPDWILFILSCITAYSVIKINSIKKM